MQITKEKHKNVGQISQDEIFPNRHLQSNRVELR